MLAEVALPGPIRSQQSTYGIHPALLDACFQSAMAHPAVQARGSGALALGVRRLRAYGPARNARYCYTTVTNADAAGVEADLDVLDQHGAVLLTVRGLQTRNRVVRERNPQSDAERTAVDHRMATARAAESGPRQWTITKPLAGC